MTRAIHINEIENATPFKSVNKHYTLLRLLNFVNFSDLCFNTEFVHASVCC